MRIRIAATSSLLTANASVSWEIDIFTNGELASSKVNVKDPLSKKDRALCRWYLNKYRQKEPYSTTKAKSAASLLQGYGSALAAQLQLAKHVQSGEPTIVEIEDCFSEQSASSASLQQLHWEFLEDVSLWPSSAAVSVHRVASSCSQTALHRDTAGAQSSNKLHLLLVTARNLEREWTADADVSPSVVSDILWEIQSKLQGDISATDLDIEMVRPGTLDALKRHLSSNRHRHYDIVHFDMHGEITSNDDGTVTGCLHFNDPDSLETKATPAKEVIEVFDGLGVSAVVFNSCDSANATFGDDGNIAKTFAQHMRVNNILAMSHMASESAIGKFLSSFYHELIINGRDFVGAAKHARSVLRDGPLRNARFHLLVPVIDWSIPVVYSSASSSVTLCESVNLSNSSLLPLTSGIPVFGRDFDCLRLEKAMLPSGVVYLYGASGVGKSTLLRRLASSWTRSNFVSHVYLVDFSSGKITSTADFVEELLLQANDFTRVHSEAAAAITSLEELCAHLATHRAAFILDGLVDREASRLGPNNRPPIEFLETVKELCRASKDGDWQTEKLIVMSGRARSAMESIWPEEMARVPMYELEGLQNADAISLVQYLNPTQESKIPDQGGADLSYAWKAEPIIGLLQGNPAGLIHFVRLARESNMALPEMYRILHSEDVVQNLAVNQLYQSFSLLPEFIDVLSTLSDESYAIWVMLAWYWHVGPIEDAFADMLLEVDIVTDKALVGTAIDEAQHLGYLRREHDGQIIGISPLFTIFMRIAACSSACRFKHSSLNAWQDFRRGFALQTLGNLVPNGSFTWLLYSGAASGPKYAIRLMITVLSPHWTRDQDEKYYRFLIRFFIAINKQCRQVFRETLSQGLVYDKMARQGNTWKENFLFSLKLCRGRGPLAVHPICWPMYLIVDIGFFVFQLYNTEQIQIVADYLEELLNGAIAFGKFSGGGHAVPLDDLSVILTLVIALGDIYRRNIPKRESRTQQFADMGSEILATSEKTFGVSSDSRLVMSKAMLAFDAARTLMDDRKPTESRAKLQEALAGFRQATGSPSTASEFGLDDLLKGKSETEAASLQALVKPMATGRKIEDVWNLALAETMGYDMNEIDAPRRSGIAESSHPLHDVWDIMLRNHRRICSPSHRLDQYENEIDRGHWSKALGHHGAMIVQSMKSLDFDQINGHLAAQENIVNQHEVEDDSLDRIHATRHMMDLIKEWMSASDSHDIKPDLIERMNKHIHHIKRFGVDLPQILKLNDILLRSLTRDFDPSLIHNQAPGILPGTGIGHSRLMSFMKAHGSRAAESRDYGTEILDGLLEVFKTQRDLEDAEDEHVVADIYKHLDKLQALTENKLCLEFLKKDGIAERRNWNTRRLLGGLATELEKVKSDIAIGEFSEQTQGLVESCRTIILLDGTQEEEFLYLLSELEGIAEGCHLSVWTRRASVALEEDKEPKKFVRIVAEMLKLHKKGDFDRALTKDYHRETFNIAWYEYFYESVILATSEGRWIAADKLFTEWRSEKKVWAMGMQDERGEAMVVMEFWSRQMACISGFWSALKDLDVARADAHLNMFRTLSTAPRQPGTPEGLGNGGILQICEITRRGVMERFFSDGAYTARQYVLSMASTIQRAGIPFEF